MKKLKSYEIRKMWLDFFESKKHDIIPSLSLIPLNDPTLLWINAGIAPLKKYFDGREVPKNRRIANAQKCIRTNDIDNVGRTARHHTFFEMLGNFSIGDYFRNEALTYAIEILTSDKWFGFDLEKLYFTVYPDDTETVKKWLSLGVSEDHIILLEGNYWEIGEGPCGPDTEIFYDRGEKYDPNGLGKKLLEEDIDNERYIEIWNIVFSQYNAISGISRSEYPELPSRNIDTGSGLERLACIMQEVETNYDTDLFLPIIEEIEKLTNIKYQGQMAFKVIVDHLRCVTFAISDGAVLSNEGRGYVLRRILRRAVRYGKKLGMNEPFMYRLVNIVVDNMGRFYNYLYEKQSDIEKIIKREEEQFLLTLESGEKKLLDYIKTTVEKIIPKETVFLLYDTFGFPFELTLEVAEEYGFSVDEEGFKEELQKQRRRAREARSVNESMNTQNEDMLNYKQESKFVGYDTLSTSSTVIGLFENGEVKESASGIVGLVFDATPFYAESGGQIGDIGVLKTNKNTYQITNTVKMPNGQHISFVDLKEDFISCQDTVLLEVDKGHRLNIAKNHSATHLLNEALRVILGNHILQQGSYVSDKNLRFDFNNYNMPTNEELFAIEALVNQKINENLIVDISYKQIEEAKKMGVQAQFGEKYGDIVRVVDMGFSKELCGGCHVINTGIIEQFSILSIESKGSGMFRIEATTGKDIALHIDNTIANINSEIIQLRKNIDILVTEITTLSENQKFDLPASASYIPSYKYITAKKVELEELRELAKETDKKYNKLKRQKDSISINEYLEKSEKIKDKNILINKCYNVDMDAFKDLVDRLSDKLPNSVVVMANITDKVVFVCKSKIPSINAGIIVKEAAIITGGNGGGRADFAQAGGKDITKVEEALAKAKGYLVSNL